MFQPEKTRLSRSVAEGCHAKFSTQASPVAKTAKNINFGSATSDSLKAI
jgi:hypothetical protein